MAGLVLNITDIHYFYLRDQHKFPVACVAVAVDHQHVNFALSVHNPMDIYNKEVARTMAVGRLVLAGMFMIVPASIRKDKGRIKYELLWEIAHRASIPQRAREAATLWLKEQRDKRRLARAIVETNDSVKPTDATLAALDHLRDKHQAASP